MGTTSNLTIPSTLIQEFCGASSSTQTFAYSINSKWRHGGHKSWAQGPAECGAQFTGGHWDPTAACSKDSSNPACAKCGTASGYECTAKQFKPSPDASGSF